MNIKQSLLLILATGIFISQLDAHAEPMIIPADGSKHQIIFTKSEPEATIISSANTNDSSRVILEILSARELTVSATSKKVAKSAKLPDVGGSNTGWNNKAIEFFAGTKGVSTFRIGGSTSESGGEYRDPLCLCLTDTEINYYLGDAGTIAVLTANGYNLDRAGLCSFYYNATGKQDCSLLGGGGGSETTSAQAIGIEMRDTCDKKSKSVSRFKIKPNVDWSQIHGSLVATVSYKSEPYVGTKVASHKPNSDGLWSPASIFLFATMKQPYGPTKEFVRVSKWNKNGPTRILDLKDGLSDVSYNDYYLHRVRSAKALRLGGKAVVELRSNAGLTYGHCMPMKKSRMNFGGY